MDALNPANPIAQDQFVMQYKVPQIKHRVPQYKIRLRVPQIKIKLKVWQLKFHVQGPAQVGQNIPVQPPQQPAPVQLVPAGIVVPALQVVYQKWIGKKPEFSGKPEEDAESHLLSTRDWMEAHNFTNEVKVRHFCLMLIGEARLWYESLAPLDDNWPALQNKFR